ncbi:trypsin-like serine protease [Thalassomonas viridans]|uniref:Trypsin-like serine protease n=1 Tax=Thalassomonas viridans TaxID=137584 RepID=A0AAF0C9J8_9GAMM|nr:trypsin-like serine protease [Thalassomonas viridans]WDE07587.1 trypsin-like serine protease [Thalassomonas viridans]
MRKIILSFIIASFSLPCFSIVTRHDIPQEKYLAKNVPEYLVDMPGEGHGVLIKPNWIVTVAHLIFSDYTGKEMLIHGQKFKIEKVILHNDAKKPDSALFKGDAKPLMDFMKTTSDIALIKLAENVSHVKPIPLYVNRDELGREITAFGRGSTGNGKNGSIFETKRQKVLRTMSNRIEVAEGNWLSITLDHDNKALALEGIDGSGDSGGPLIISDDGKQYLAGLFSWDYVEGDLKSFKHGLYGGKSYQIRISSYANWINQKIKSN